jgi:hypothetical protein
MEIWNSKGDLPEDKRDKLEGMLRELPKTHNYEKVKQQLRTYILEGYDCNVYVGIYFRYKHNA